MRTMVAFLVLLAVAAAVHASFAAAPGFSGRVADCTSCHRPPLHGDDATVAIDGLPDAWDPGAHYAWTVSVEGGPATLPGGPEAGFEIEVLDGSLQPGPDDGGSVRSFHGRQATYTEDGVFQRAWSVAWNAPGLEQRPAPVTVWVAAIAANGNHNVMLNASDAGEHGDSVATMVYTIPPSDAAQRAWQDLPLAAPIVDKIAPAGDGHTLHGRLTDANATHIEVYDGRGWAARAVAPSWRLQVSGSDEVRLRASGADRTSPEVLVHLDAGETVPVQPADAPLERAPAVLPLLPLFLALRRRP